MSFLKRWRDAINARLTDSRRYKLAIANEILDKVDKHVQDLESQLVNRSEYDAIDRSIRRRIWYYESLKLRALRLKTKCKRSLQLTEAQAQAWNGRALMREYGHLRRTFRQELLGMDITPTLS